MRCEHLTKLSYAYMVNKEVWSQSGLGKNVVCPSCLETALGRKLTVLDFSEKLHLPLNYKIEARLFGTVEDRQKAEEDFLVYLKSIKPKGNEK